MRNGAFTMEKGDNENGRAGRYLAQPAGALAFVPAPLTPYIKRFSETGTARGAA